MPCVICGLPLDTKSIGYDDGTGQKFVHPECYYREQSRKLAATLAEWDAFFREDWSTDAGFVALRKKTRALLLSVRP